MGFLTSWNFCKLVSLGIGWSLFQHVKAHPIQAPCGMTE